MAAHLLSLANHQSWWKQEQLFDRLCSEAALWRQTVLLQVHSIQHLPSTLTEAVTVLSTNPVDKGFRFFVDLPSARENTHLLLAGLKCELEFPNSELERVCTRVAWEIEPVWLDDVESLLKREQVLARGGGEAGGLYASQQRLRAELSTLPPEQAHARGQLLQRVKALKPNISRLFRQLAEDPERFFTPTPEEQPLCAAILKKLQEKNFLVSFALHHGRALLPELKKLVDRVLVDDINRYANYHVVLEKLNPGSPWEKADWNNWFPGIEPNLQLDLPAASKLRQILLDKGDWIGFSRRTVYSAGQLAARTARVMCVVPPVNEGVAELKVDIDVERFEKALEDVLSQPWSYKPRELVQDARNPKK